MIVYCYDRILLSISPYSEHIAELCQQRALEGHCGRKVLSSSGGRAESGCCGVETSGGALPVLFLEPGDFLVTL